MRDWVVPCVDVLGARGIRGILLGFDLMNLSADVGNDKDGDHALIEESDILECA